MIWIFRFFDFLAIVLPIKVASLVTTLISFVMYCLSYVGIYKRGRIWVTKNLRQAGISSCGLSSFIGFARNISEFMMITKLNRKNLCQWAEPVGIKILDSELRKGKGVILLTGHIGAWDLAAAAVAVMGYPINVVSIRWRGEAMTDFYERRRKRKGIEVIYIDEELRELRALRAMIRVLRRGEILAILGDRVFSDKVADEGIDVQFFGKAVKFPYGAFGLAQKTGASIVPIFAVHDKGGVRLCFEKPIKEMSQYISLLEKYIRQYSEEWCAFDRIWT